MALPYHGHYTVSEYALVKGEMLKVYQNLYSSNTVDHICRWVAKNDWPKVRSETYQAVLNLENRVSVLSGFEALSAYDLCQELFDKAHHGQEFERVLEVFSITEESTVA